MAQLNQAAAECMKEVVTSACTDITGFGLLGHLHEMTTGSGVDAQISLDAVPIIPKARELAAMNVIPGGTLNNLEFVAPHVTFEDHISHVDQVMLADAQTSGGLLISLPEIEATRLFKIMLKKGINAFKIGEILGSGTGNIHVL